MENKNITDALFAIISNDFSDVNNPVINKMIETQKFIAELRKESDRGCALLAVSALDSQLEKSLKKILVGSNKHLKSMFDFSGPLGSLSSRCNLAFAIGKVSRECFLDMKTVREIRNIFAHTIDTHSFEEPKIKTMVNNLRSFILPGVNGRLRFETACAFISMEVELFSLDEPFMERISEAPQIIESVTSLSKKIDQVKAKVNTLITPEQ